MPDPASPFASLGEAELRVLSPRGVVRSFPKGAVLMNEGDGTDALYVLLLGRVKAFVSDAEGREFVFGTVGVGDYFGELVLDGGVRSASVMALEACRIYLIPRTDVEDLIERNPRFARHLLNRLIGRVRSLTAQVKDLTLNDIYGRFVAFIEANAVEKDGRRIVPDRLTQHDIAARIGASRETVSRIIKDLAAGGYISIDSKYVTLHKKLPAKW